MSTRVEAYPLNPPVFWPAEGVSKESEIINSLANEISTERRRPASFAWRDLLFAELSEVMQTCADDGWDGYDAEPISQESASSAAQLIQLLPESIQIPSVVPEPSGDISLEWRTEDQKHFTLSIMGPALVYAGIFGGSSKDYGEERIFRALPRKILDILTSNFSEA